MNHLRSACVLAVTGSCFAAAAHAQASASALADLSLEQLANIEITSVSRRQERLSGAAGSVYVITGDDIRRSGVTSLPEALRLAPNLHVARSDANQYAISTRGFNSTTANKILVMIDGRTVYSTLFSGVFWDEQDLMLDDVERIEVMSGSGGTAWGSNAVNGFINIITKPAGDTQGVLASAGGGNREAVASARYGGTLQSGGRFRLYGKYARRDHTETTANATRFDGSRRSLAGFRTDWGGPMQGATVQGSVYYGDIDQAPAAGGDKHLRGVNLLGRWVSSGAEGSQTRLQAYYDRTERAQPGTFRDEQDTLDIEAQHFTRLTASQQLLFGGGYRYQIDRVDNISPALAFYPARKVLRLANVFAQDDVALAPGVDLTLGLKLEHNVYTGLEYLPNARLAWKPADGHLLWGAVSRTVRIPARLDRDLYAPATPPFVALAGGPDFQSEISHVYELGYRGQPASALSYSLTLFHHDFERQRSIEPGVPGPTIDNQIHGHLNGIEAWGSWRVASWWRLNAGGVYQKLRLKPDAGSVSSTANLGNDPRNYWRVGSSMDLGAKVQLDAWLRHVGALPNPKVPAYTALDVRLGWRVRPELELSLTGQNLLDARHTEFGAAPGRSELERSVFFKAIWQLP